MPTSPVALANGRANPAFGQFNRPSVRVADRPSELSRKTIIPSITQPPKHDPVFYITGGPGGDAMGEVEFVVPTLNQDQDLIVLSQRGTWMPSRVFCAPKSRHSTQRR